MDLAREKVRSGRVRWGTLINNIFSEAAAPDLARYGFLTAMSVSSRLGGKSVFLVFVLFLVAAVTDSQLTQVSSARGISSDDHNLIPPQ